MAKAKYPPLIESVSEYLRENKFRQRALGFNRKTNDPEVTEVITIQRGRSWLEGKFTIELGVYVPKIQALAYPESEVPVFPQACDCCFRGRLPILAGWKDHWWESNREQDLLEIEMLLDRFGWPFLEDRNSLERIFAREVRAFEIGKSKDHSFDKVVILFLAGRSDYAQVTLRDLFCAIKSRGYSTGAVEALAHRLGIKLEPQ